MRDGNSIRGDGNSILEDVFSIPGDGCSILEDIFPIPEDGFSIPGDVFSIPEDGIPIPKDVFSISNDNLIVDENELFIVDDFVNVDGHLIFIVNDKNLIPNDNRSGSVADRPKPTYKSPGIILKDLWRWIRGQASSVAPRSGRALKLFIEAWWVFTPTFSFSNPVISLAVIDRLVFLEEIFKKIHISTNDTN